MIINVHKKILISAMILFSFALCYVFRFSFLFAEKAENKKTLTVIMYHSVVKENPGKYKVTERQLESDLNALCEKGYTSVTLKDITDFTSGKSTDFPDKAVLITFDDGYLNNYTGAMPLLKSHGMTAVLAVVGTFTEEAQTEKYRSPSYSYLTFKDIRELADGGVFEIACHSYGCHKITSEQNGIGKIKGESSENYKKRFSDDLLKWENLFHSKCGITAYCYVYPFGTAEKDADSVLREKGYTVTLSCTEGINSVYPGKDIYRLNRYNRSGNISTSDFFKKIEKNS